MKRLDDWMLYQEYPIDIQQERDGKWRWDWRDCISQTFDTEEDAFLDVIIFLYKQAEKNSPPMPSVWEGRSISIREIPKQE